MGHSDQPTRPSILFLTRALDLGGAQRQLVELALGLHRTGWRVQVLVFYGDGALEAQLASAGIGIVVLRKRGRWDTLGFMGRMVRAIRGARPDIVHGYLDVANILLAVFRPMFPKARLVWGVRASNVDLTRYDRLARVVFDVGVLFSRCAHLIICNSESGRVYHAGRGYPRDRMIVIPNGVDLQQFRPDEGARNELRAEWGIDADEKLVGLVARLDPMKDHPNFLQAAAQIAAKWSNVKFVCVGDGPASYRAHLAAMAKELGLGDRLRWAGARTDMWRVYNAFDLAVSCSAFGEGTSNAMAEAMATGVPCVATDTGDARALVGEAGWICPTRDSGALHRTIMDALSTLPLDGDAIRRRMASEFGSDVLIRRTAEHLYSLTMLGSVAGRNSAVRYRR